MSPTNLLTPKEKDDTDSKMIDPKMVETVTNTLLRAMQEGSPFYFYINQNTMEAKMGPGEVLIVTRVKGAHTMKFKIDKVTRVAVTHCAQRVIEVLS